MTLPLGEGDVARDAQGWPVITGGQGEIAFFRWDQISKEVARVQALMGPSTDPAAAGEAIVPKMILTPQGLVILR